MNEGGSGLRLKAEAPSRRRPRGGEYWIVNPETETVEQYLLGSSGYELKVKAATGTITSKVIAGLTLPVRAIFDEPENLAVLRQWM